MIASAGDVNDDAAGFIGKGSCRAVSMMHDKPFAGAEQFVGDHKGSNGVVAGSATGIANDVSVALPKAGGFGWIEVRIHAGENRKTPRGWQGKFGSFTESVGIGFI